MPPAQYGRDAQQSRLRAALSRLCPSPAACCPLGARPVSRSIVSRSAVSLVALLAPLALAGCASGGATPMGDTLRDAWGGGDDLAGRAAEITFASLALEADDRRGLVVLGALAKPESYWPTGNRGLVTLRHEGLHATAGLAADLLDTRYSLDQGEAESEAEREAEAPWQLATPARFSVTRTWQHANGLTEQMSAEGTLECVEPEPYDLPLATLALEPCHMALRWESGQTTQGRVWRDPHTRRVWAAEEQAWPDGPKLSWEVARPWW